MGIGLLLGTAWSLLQPLTYSATASVVLVPVPIYVIPSTSGLLPPEVSIDTDAQLLRTPEVLTEVGDTLGISASAAEDHVSLTASANSHVLHVTVSATSAEQAARAANAAVTAFVELRRVALGALKQSQLRQLRLYVAEQEALLAREQAKRLVIAGLDDLSAQVLELRRGLEELEEARRQPAQVVRPAQSPRVRTTPIAEVPMTSGAMLGLLCGCLLGAARDRTRRPGQQQLPSPPRSSRGSSRGSPALIPRGRRARHRHPTRGSPPWSLTRHPPTARDRRLEPCATTWWSSASSSPWAR